MKLRFLLPLCFIAMSAITILHEFVTGPLALKRFGEFRLAGGAFDPLLTTVLLLFSGGVLIWIWRKTDPTRRVAALYMLVLLSFTLQYVLLFMYFFVACHVSYCDL